MPDASTGIADALQHLAHDPSPDNWRQVVEGAWPIIAGACHRIARPYGDDAIQEALLHIRAGARHFQPRGPDPDGDARHWLRRIATTSALAVLRSERRTRARAIHATAPTASPAPDEAAALTDDLALLRDELAGLREPDRTAVALHHLEGQDIAAVGQALGCTTEAVRKRIARALEVLHTRLAGRGVVLGLAGVATALQQAGAVEVVTTPTPAALGLIASPLAPTTSITLGIGVALMATTCTVAVVLSSTLAWVYVHGAEPAPTPGISPVVAVPAQVITSDMPAIASWLDVPFPSGPWQEAVKLGEARKWIADGTGHPMFFDTNWFVAGRRMNEPFPLAGMTPRAAVDLLCKRVDAGWLVIEDQILVTSTDTIARLQKPMASKASLQTWLTQLQKTIETNIVVDPGVSSEGRFVPVAWANSLPAFEAMGRLAQANHWQWTELKEGFLLAPAPAVRPIMEPAPMAFIIRGRPWTRSAMEQLVSCDFQGASMTDVVQELTRQTGIPISWNGGAGGDVTLRMQALPLRNVTEWISAITGLTLTEPEIGKRLEFVRAKP